MTDLERRTRALQLLRKYTPRAKDAWDLEASIFQYTATSCTDFEAKVRQIAWNVCQSPALLDVYNVNTLVHLDNATLARGTAVETWHETHKSNMRHQHVLLHEEHKGEDGSLICNRCNSRDVDVYQKQTRSADEGMTVFCHCSTCGMRWKM